ncbi:hypothetical protein AMECASPLE_005665 [Ameca splendens]|uniref:Uncharacterized protein n=1 Tax=Ameca splendens TaxID=208324 RepID=A0ABV0YXS4_9TELE
MHQSLLLQNTHSMVLPLLYFTVGIFFSGLQAFYRSAFYVVFLCKWPFSSCQYKTHFSLDDDILTCLRHHLRKVFFFCSGLICTFCSETHFQLCDTEPVSFLYSLMDEPDLLRSAINFLILWLISPDFFSGLII